MKYKTGYIKGPTLIKGISFLTKDGTWVYHEATKPFLIGLPDDEWILSPIRSAS